MEISESTVVKHIESLQYTFSINVMLRRQCWNTNRNVKGRCTVKDLRQSFSLHEGPYRQSFSLHEGPSSEFLSAWRTFVRVSLCMKVLRQCFSLHEGSSSTFLSAWRAFVKVSLCMKGLRQSFSLHEGPYRQSFSLHEGPSSEFLSAWRTFVRVSSFLRTCNFVFQIQTCDSSLLGGASFTFDQAVANYRVTSHESLLLRLTGEVLFFLLFLKTTILTLPAVCRRTFVNVNSIVSLFKTVLRGFSKRAAEALNLLTWVPYI